MQVNTAIPDPLPKTGGQLGGRSLHSSMGDNSLPSVPENTHADQVSISEEALSRSSSETTATTHLQDKHLHQHSSNAPDSNDQPSAAQQDAEQELLRELASRDLEVRTHEQAHAVAGGQLAGAATYSFRQGPDGVRYAVAGEVSIDVSDVSGDPQATLEKMSRVRRAALAPAEPSLQDRQVAAMATQKMMEARADMATEQREALEADADMRAERHRNLDAEAEHEDSDPAQNKAKKMDDESMLSAVDRAAEYNERLKHINELLLLISSSSISTSGTLLDDQI